MRPLMFTLSLSSALALSACAGGVSGSFRGKGGQAGPPVAPSAVKVVASKADMTASYTELGIAKGSAPTAQQAVDQAKIHCGQNGGSYLILNTPPFLSGNSWSADATCANLSK